MQTNFSPAQLKNPATAAAEKILRACVHCGFCNATCPTFVLLGDELDSPRGRIYLIKDMLEQNRPADALTVKHIDRCLSCLACMTACPSGVNYMHLVDGARSHIEKTFVRPLADRLLRAFLGAILPYPKRSVKTRWFRSIASAQARARSSHGSALRGAIAVAMARAAAIWAGFSTSKVCVVADIRRPPLGRCSTITGAGGGVTTEASQGHRYWIQVWWK
jgi:Fe-S oxidoreductase